MGTPGGHRGMRVIGRQRLTEFYGRHEDAKAPLLAWLEEAKAAEWQTPHDVKARYPKASMLGDRRIVFNIRGNHYRLDVKISYKSQEVVVVRVGTHKEYDGWSFT